MSDQARLGPLDPAPATSQWGPQPAASARTPLGLRRTVRIGVAESQDDGEDETTGGPTEVASVTSPPLIQPGDDTLFRNTYYDFPSEASFAAASSAGDEERIYDPSCRPIAVVARAFYETLCVQGSGRLKSGTTVSFARRGCPCTTVCPRTGQQICFQQLDPNAFPWGRGSTGRAITPLRSVAVDPAVIALGSSVMIPEMVGLPLPDGSTHDGCFLAEDRGVGVAGRHVDVFTGDSAMTAAWNARVPSNAGVHVIVNGSRCPAPSR